MSILFAKVLAAGVGLGSHVSLVFGILVGGAQRHMPLLDLQRWAAVKVRDDTDHLGSPACFL